MVFKSVLLTGVMATAAMAATLGTSVPIRSCGAPKPSQEHMAIHQAFAEQEANDFQVAAATDINVNVYFHVVATSTTSKGYLSDAILQNQLKVLNDNYAPSGISFTLKGIDRTVNSNWANDKAEMTMKKSLRKGTYSDLNVYFMNQLQDNALGYCYFPLKTSTGSNDFIKDGCSILYSTVPGGELTGYNEGKTTTHEVGHWFGLYHTFQGGCDGPGDYVDDTPPEASPASGCPVGRHTCPKQPLEDPIHNFMDYSSDSCMYEFTPGQTKRMVSFWNQYRG